MKDRLSLSFVLFISSPLSGELWEEGERGALLGSIISIWDRIWSCKKLPLPLGSGKPLKWPFGPLVAA